MFHILVVEDDQALNKLICRVLNKNGYETASATDGEEALALLDQMYIDLIITDLMMPNMDGYDLTKALRDSGYQLPILVVTARDTFPDKAKGFKLGIDDYMVKPIDVNELLLRVEALLRRAKIIYEKKLEFDHVCLDYINLTVTIDDNSQILPQKEFQLLARNESGVLRIGIAHTRSHALIPRAARKFRDRYPHRGCAYQQAERPVPGYSLFSDPDRKGTWL